MGVWHQQKRREVYETKARWHWEGWEEGCMWQCPSIWAINPWILVPSHHSGGSFFKLYIYWDLFTHYITHPFKVYNEVSFGMFAKLCNHYYHLTSKHSYDPPPKKPIPISYHPTNPSTLSSLLVDYTTNNRLSVLWTCLFGAFNINRSRYLWLSSSI